MPISQIVTNSIADSAVVTVDIADLAVTTAKIANSSVTTAKLGSDVGLFGVGQTWQDVSASRSTNTDYTNNTGKPIQLSLNFQLASGSSISLIIGGVTVNAHTYGIGSAGWFYAVVPNNTVYRITTVGSPTRFAWTELR